MFMNILPEIEKMFEYWAIKKESDLQKTSGALRDWTYVSEEYLLVYLFEISNDI